MGNASAKAAMAASPKTGTVSAKAAATSMAAKMPIHKKLSVQSNNDLKAKIFSNLGVLDEAHESYKEIYFRQNLPFYTCVNAATNTWKKEFPDGSVQYVHQYYDAEKAMLKEEPVKHS